MIGLFGETVRLETPTGYVDLHGCSVQSASSVEPRDGTSSRVVTDIVVFMPPETASSIQANDRLTIRGYAYDVEGTPTGEVSTFTGMAAMVPVTVRRVTG